MTSTIRTPEPKQARHTTSKKRRTRFSSMESLGFIESPATVSNSWSASPQPAPVSAADTEPRRKRGAHERTVADLEPNDTSELLVGRHIRWGLLTMMVVLTGALTAAAIWLMQRPAVQAESAVTAVESAAQSLGPELTSLTEIAARLADQDIDSASVAAQTRAVEARARDLFNAAGALPSTAADQRTIAAETATNALDASRLISDAVAYRSTVIQVLVMPELETDPKLVGLDEAVLAFGTWQLNFNQIRSALPTGTMSEVSAEIALLAGSLESSQSRYIDALRDNDQTGAEMVLADLAARLERIDTLLFASMEEVQERASELLESSLAGVDALIS